MSDCEKRRRSWETSFRVWFGFVFVVVHVVVVVVVVVVVFRNASSSGNSVFLFVCFLFFFVCFLFFFVSAENSSAGDVTSGRGAVAVRGAVARHRPIG